MMRIGVDVGGTFTDVILTDTASAQIWTTKVATTPGDPVEGAFHGIAEILRISGASADAVAFVGHGTTLATNLIVEGKGARTALVTTRGFRDVLEIRRASRHDRADLYDLFFDSPAPMAARRDRFEVDERTLHDGSVAIDLDVDSLDAAIEAVAASGVEAVAVCLLHAYRNPTNERHVLAALRDRLPNVFSTASADVNPEMFEYERTSTTVINAALGPRCGGYIRGFRDRVRETGLKADLLFMQSNGGLATPGVTAALPVTLLQSGPAGGVTAAEKLCRRLGLRDAITGDMGGTTFDVSLIRDFAPEIRTSGHLATHAVRAPTIDIESIGAGGGSIAWVDAGGGLNVGPRSAGADPGPACYGRGGNQATVTDCNLLLGYVDPGSFLGGGFALDAAAAERVVRERLAVPLGLDVIEAARAVRALANANMAQAIRLMTVERGYDPRELAYVAYGGGGPVHAVDLAYSLGITTIVIPPTPGLFSALGMLVADQVYDAQQAVLVNLDRIQGGAVASRLSELEAELHGRLTGFDVDVDAVRISRRAECRYLGQAEGLTLDLGGLPSDPHAWAPVLKSRFEDEHRRHWNFIQPDRPIELINLRLRAVVPAQPVDQEGAQSRNGGPPTRVGERGVHLSGGPCNMGVFDRRALSPGDHLTGPCIVQEESSCLVVSEDWALDVHPSLALILKRIG